MSIVRRFQNSATFTTVRLQPPNSGHFTTRRSKANLYTVAYNHWVLVIACRHGLLEIVTKFVYLLCAVVTFWAHNLLKVSTFTPHSRRSKTSQYTDMLIETNVLEQTTALHERQHGKCNVRTYKDYSTSLSITSLSSTHD